MEEDKPKNIQEYKKWLSKKHGADVSSRTEAHYRAVTSSIKDGLGKSHFWTELMANLGEFDSEYELQTGYALLLDLSPQLRVKPFGSFLLKTFRKNILENDRWPEEPEEKWYLPSNWYSKVNDIVRTLLVIKYLDGVEFMVEKIQALCSRLDLPCSVSLEAREEGYYAAHVYTRHAFEIPRLTWDTERADVSIEIQLTTQLQDVIRKLLHKYYEDRRRTAKEPSLKWQWNYKSDEFAAGYLGHILHYVEGMIVEVRKRQKESTT